LVSGTALCEVKAEGVDAFTKGLSRLNQGHTVVVVIVDNFRSVDVEERSVIRVKLDINVSVLRYDDLTLATKQELIQVGQANRRWQYVQTVSRWSVILLERRRRVLTSVKERRLSG